MVYKDKDWSESGPWRWLKERWEKGKNLITFERASSSWSPPNRSDWLSLKSFSRPTESDSICLCMSPFASWMNALDCWSMRSEVFLALDARWLKWETAVLVESMCGCNDSCRKQQSILVYLCGLFEKGWSLTLSVLILFSWSWYLSNKLQILRFSWIGFDVMWRDEEGYPRFDIGFDSPRQIQPNGVSDWFLV